MDLPETDIVKAADARPAGRPDECFYCRAKLGVPHDGNCVIKSRSVVVELTIRAVITAPRDWERSMVDFHLNDSSWCADNILRDLGRWADSRGEHDGCACGAFEGRFLREASADDHEHLPVLIELPDA